MIVIKKWLLFFFQAEDGIRYRNVTGVKTCALPICILKITAKFDFYLSQQLAYETECGLPHLNHHLSSRTAAEGRTVKYQKTGSYAVNSIHGGSIIDRKSVV